ncbi:MAG: hypothetical protein B9S32_12690 [Verrucomicrobia bacterium Tous-C9LFEB]|nr:MAG: hypothetical protein B9S32_12690 [Verrucomicrobia bacterium Tous-C9LFEB]
MNLRDPRAPRLKLSGEPLYLLVLTALWILSAAAASHLTLQIYQNFRGVACDTAASQNAIVNILNGHWFRCTAYCGPHILGIHSHFIFVLLAAIYALIPSTDFFYILQNVGALSVVFPVYFVAKEILKNPFTACLIAIAALLNPMLANLCIIPLHPEPWILPALFWAYYFYLKNRPLAFWLCFLFSVCCGELAAITYAALGVAWLLSPRRFPWTRRYGWFALVGGLGWIAFTMGWLMPTFRTAEQFNNFGSKYSEIGASSPLQLFQVMLSNPKLVLGKLLDVSRWVRALDTVGPALLLIFASWESALLLLPVPLFWLMNNNELFIQIHAYYFQFVFLAAHLGLIAFLRRWDFSTRIGKGILIAVLCLNGVFLVYEYTLMKARYHGDGEEQANTELRREFARIPVEAGVYAPHRHSGYLSNRVNMVMGDLQQDHLDFDQMIAARQAETTVRPDQIDYIVVDQIADQCGPRKTLFKQEITQKRHANIQKLVDSGRWQIIYNQEYVVILQRRR